MTIAQMRELEKQTVDAMRVQDPSRVERAEVPNPDLVMGLIGVTYLSPERADGYIRLYPQDFIVEEITEGGELVHLDQGREFADSEDRRTLWADLVKANLSGPNSLDEVRRALNLDEKQVMAAGIKDAVALTAQRLSIRGATREQVEAIDNPNYFLRPIGYGSGALQIGQLKGNRFTIVIRGQVQQSRKMFDRSFAFIREKGFLNFFGPQRFGSRLNVHHLGKRLIQGDVEGAIRAYMGDAGPFDVPLYREIRQAMGAAYGDWAQMQELAKHFPFTFKDEMQVVQALQEDPRKTRAALSRIKEQVRLWVYAYGSWLVNRAISRAINNGETLPAQLPMPFSPRGPLPMYQEFMEADGTTNYVQTLSQYPYINLADRTIPTVMMPQGLEAKEIDQGWIVRFQLGKGAYATSLLSHLVRMYEGLPVPTWVPDGDVDALAAMGEGSVENLRTKFGKLMVRRDAVEENEEGE